MKSVLYVGATLMIGASIYGFVDYKNTNHRKEFKEMYHEKESSQPLDPPVSGKTTEETTDVVMVTEKELTKKENVKIEALPAAKKTIVKKNQPSSKVKKFKRKLNYKSFSRAPLREDQERERTPQKKTSSEAIKL